MNFMIAATVLGFMMLIQMAGAAYIEKVDGIYKEENSLESSLQDAIMIRNLNRRDNNQEAEDVDPSFNQYMELKEDKWVAFLATASPNHFEKLIKKIKKIFGKGYEEEEEETEEEIEEPGDGYEQPPADEEDDCEDSKTANYKKSLERDIFVSSSMINETKPFAEFLFKLKDYANKGDLKNVLKEAGDFNYENFGMENTDNDNVADFGVEHVTFNDVKGSDMKKWLKNNAKRRAEIIQLALTDDHFNDTAIFEAEEFEYRKGNIFLDEDENDLENSGCTIMTRRSIVSAILAFSVAIFGSF
ncbi:hypothetical protein FOA43_003596 [Brettanomyces nanus]|uniref:Uncharacterized protein n=1 Tax=Eeniella nana TaxID=13502 RepID=A0A875RQ90_EENNA|nr:uncharacterized protein FOA43_003596 [Brettanomyces nanus]QPG76210.1 hypothetical protein FOA43_003596 [Brettanomyces nanus]